MKLRLAIAPRFSLRFLLAAVAACSGYLAWQRSVVLERQAAMREWNAAGALLLTPEQAEQWPILPRSAKKQARVSFVRRMLGDEPIQLIHFPQDFKPSTDRAAALFPEAQTFRGGYVF